MRDSLQRSRGHRASLRAAIGDVESALAAPAPGREGLWRQQLGGSLDVLGDALESHSTSAEADDGLLAEIMSEAPRLAPRVERARTDHQRMRSDLQDSADAVAAGADVSELRERVIALLTELVRHRQLGADLVYDAYNVDIEASD